MQRDPGRALRGAMEPPAVSLVRVDVPPNPEMYFPRYLFAFLRFKDEAIGAVNDTTGVSSVVCSWFEGAECPSRV